MSNNDNKILELKRQIQEKKEKLSKSERFNPITTCVINAFDKKLNINVLNEQGLIDLLVWVNSLKMSCDNLKIEDYKLDGFSLNDWMTDINNKLSIKNRKSEEEKLKKLESKLESMLSEDKKIELELNEISKMI